mgnify:CR=1 FL=1
MRDTKIHPEIHEPVQEPLGGSDLGGIVIESASTPQTSTQHEPENSHSAAFEQPLKEVNSLTDRSWKCLHKRRRGWKGGRQYISCERREWRERIPEIEVFVTLLLRSANIQVGKVDFDFDLFYSNARFYDIHCYEKTSTKHASPAKTARNQIVLIILKLSTVFNLIPIYPNPLFIPPSFNPSSDYPLFWFQLTSINSC